MGFFDKAKTFMGGSSMVTLEFLDIERQPPESATLPIGDSVVKGRYRITAQKDCEVLRHVAEFRTRLPAKDGTLGTCHIEDVEDERNAVIGAPYKLPYKMKAGETVDGAFLLSPLDIPAFLQKSYGAPVMAPGVEVFVKIMIDVKGSPFDPEFEAKLNIIS